MKKRKYFIHFRPLQYFFRRNWYGIRKGPIWSIDNKNAFLIDLGAITIGYKE